MSEPFLGEIRLMSFNFAPRGWAQCNGQFLPINQNQALFSLLGTRYGGNGQTNFALPNLQGRVAIHVADDFNQGQVGGEEFHTLSIAEMPTHTHVLSGTNNNATQIAANPNAASNAYARSGNQMYSGPANLVAMLPNMVGNVGGSQPHENRQPYTVLNYVIALQGIFPSRN